MIQSTTLNRTQESTTAPRTVTFSPTTTVRPTCCPSLSETTVAAYNVTKPEVKAR